MIDRRRDRTPILALLIAVLALALAACGAPGVSAEDAEAMRDELSTVQDRLDEIEAEIDALEAEEVDAQAVADAVRGALAEARDTTSAIREDLEPPEPAPDPGLGDGGLDPAAPAAPATPPAP